MTWQEQLQQLDAALAAGSISAEDYRRQRDELLYRAQGGTQQPQQAGPSTGPNSDPFPAPFKWSAQSPAQQGQPQPQQGQPPQGQQTGSESTQYIRPATPPTEADRTQVVPNSGGQADRTQVVPKADRPQAVGGQQGGAWQGQQQGGAPWQQQQQQQQQGGYSPPWGGEGDFQSPQWSGFNVQGPEVFEEAEKGGKGKVIAVAAAVVVLLVATGLYFFVFRDNSGGDDTATGGTSPSSAAPTTTTKKKPDPFGTLIVPEGRTSGPKTYTAEQLANAKPLPTPDLVVLKQAGTTEARSVVVVENEVTTSMWAFKSADPAALLEAITTDQQRFGFTEDPQTSQDGVPVFKSTQTSNNKTITVFRTHYATDTEVIRVEAFAVDEPAVQDRFEAVLTEQLDHQAPKK
ncbi:SHOCT domain-containing protein [Saccharothrix xinjiangensis]|uniref:SHOCT domain-containing protein n=1 Tax=Saccharothrix xinjiangensis TaxID=204798 RepID=A0ABV9Y274_9PSEU